MKSAVFERGKLLAQKCCFRIWDRLVEMASGGKTIIITTHYIEETKQSNAVGLATYIYCNM